MGIELRALMLRASYEVNFISWEVVAWVRAALESALVPTISDYKPIDNYQNRREEQFQKRGQGRPRFGSCKIYFIER